MISCFSWQIPAKMYYLEVSLDSSVSKALELSVKSTSIKQKQENQNTTYQTKT